MANKSLYHSELVKSHGSSPFAIEIVDKSFKNTYGTSVKVKYKGQDLFLKVENQAIKDLVDAQVGKTIQVIAKGARNDALLELVGTTQDHSQNDDCATFLERSARVYSLCFAEGMKLRVQVEAEFGQDLPEGKMSDAQFQAMVSSLFISAKDYIRDMPL